MSALTMRRISCVTLSLVLPALAALLPAAPQLAAAQTAAGMIAYVGYNTSNAAEIRLIAPDGAGDRRILSLPASAGGYAPSLAWRPDAGELAFSSDHEAATSLFNSDIYAIRPDGMGLRRLTNGPDTSALAGYPKGSVTVNVQAGGGGPYLVYVAGAAAPQTVTGSARLTFNNVADFGPGRQQGVVAINGLYRWLGGAADVQPGQTVDAGTLSIFGAGSPYNVDRPTWRADGTDVGFISGIRCGSFDHVPANPPDGSLGATLLAPNVGLDYTCSMDRGPTLALANQVLYEDYDVLTAGRIYRTSEGSTDRGQLLYSFDSAENLIDLKWLPDGSGFLFAVTGNFQANSNIWEYNFATQAVTQITRFSSEFAGHFAISPDGQSIVFERAATGSAQTDLWLMSRAGGNLRLFKSKASRPAWSLRAPPTPYYVYVPLVRR